MRWRRLIGTLVAVLVAVAFVVMPAESTAEAGAAAQVRTNGSGLQYSLSSVVGAKQGKIQGDQKDGSIPIYYFGHSVTSPRDAGSGMATGRRQHAPLVIRKEIDRTSPLFYNALTTNESLMTVVLRVNRAVGPAPAGTIYTVALKDASVAGMTQGIDENGLPYEEITLTYQRITWTWTDGGVTSTDDWSPPR